MSDQPIKDAFSKVKEDIKALEIKFEVINTKLDEIIQRTETNKPKTTEFEEIKPQKQQNQEISSGNEGVQSINHSLIIQQSFTDQSLSTEGLQRIEDKFKALTHREFLLFLTIYNLEDQLGRGITYDDLSSKIKLSTGCIRGYISAVIKKGLPLTKFKLNNRTVILKINSHFRDLNLKNRLNRLYLDQDPDQTTLD